MVSSNEALFIWVPIRADKNVQAWFGPSNTGDASYIWKWFIGILSLTRGKYFIAFIYNFLGRDSV